jgi:hypothetical protein
MFTDVMIGSYLFSIKLGSGIGQNGILNLHYEILEKKKDGGNSANGGGGNNNTVNNNGNGLSNSNRHNNNNGIDSFI